MLIEFSVGNYRSFNDIVTFSMVAANLTSLNKKLDTSNIFHYKKSIHLTKTAAIYGANASGKSNFVRAFAFMRDFIFNSSKESQADEEIGIDKFQLSTATDHRPSFFEAIFVMNGIRYRYGFEIDNERVHSEWLYRAKERETNLFLREGKRIEQKGTFSDSDGKGLDGRTRENALFLSVCAQWNGKISIDILTWFRKCMIVSGLDDTASRVYTMRQLKNSGLKNKIIEFIRMFDHEIRELNEKQSVMTESDLPNEPRELQKIGKFLLARIHEFGLAEDIVRKSTIHTIHRKYNDKNEYVGDEIFDLALNESDGTQKAFSFSGPLFHALEYGLILFVDELDARFHPIITQAIVQMFHDKRSNPKNAQLIFATHDTNLLNNRFFRRDQIWFMEKNKYGATDLYSLLDFKVRNDASFKKDYIAGRYGGIPFLGGIDRLWD